MSSAWARANAASLESLAGVLIEIDELDGAVALRLPTRLDGPMIEGESGILSIAPS
jgi:hypothetical protein